MESKSEIRLPNKRYSRRQGQKQNGIPYLYSTAIVLKRTVLFSFRTHSEVFIHLRNRQPHATEIHHQFSNCLIELQRAGDQGWLGKKGGNRTGKAMLRPGRRRAVVKIEKNSQGKGKGTQRYGCCGVI